MNPIKHQKRLENAKKKVIDMLEDIIENYSTYSHMAMLSKLNTISEYVDRRYKQTYIDYLTVKSLNEGLNKYDTSERYEKKRNVKRGINNDI